MNMYYPVFSAGNRDGDHAEAILLELPGSANKQSVATVMLAVLNVVPLNAWWWRRWRRLYWKHLLAQLRAIQ